ncbi:MAG: galactose mutarotase [Saprospiraceae bacterium]|nr:galactose mutarotase [Saprospiraceae bacterium]
MKKIYPFALLLVIAAVCFLSCKNTPSQPKAGIEKASYSMLPDGRPVDIYTLRNEKGMTLRITNYGGTIVSWTAPDRNGVYQDVVLGCDSLSGYLKGTPYFGAIIGRYGNRIAKGKFTLGTTTYTLATNNIGNHLHGGIQGFDKVLWEAIELQGDNPTLQLRYFSRDMEEGYPGGMQAEVTYTLLKNNTLSIHYSATTDKPTVVNLTNHAYFNLADAGKSDILGHELMLNTPMFLPVDSTLIPTGELRPVKGTVFDFSQPTKIGLRINDSSDIQIKYGLGYDHCWITAKSNSRTPENIASLYDAASGRFMEVFTTEPAVQFYSGNFLDGTVIGKGGTPYQHRTGLCLETQHYPDSPNHPAFPSTLLNPGEKYESTTEYRFSVK